MSSINNQNKDETSGFKREGQYYPNTTGERVATHIPGTEAHAERNELQGRTSPGARGMANVPGTAEHERKREYQREIGTGLTNPADDARDVYGTHGRGNYDTQGGIYGASAADPVGTTDRGTGNIPSTGAAHNEYAAGTEHRVGLADKVIGATEKTLGKAMNKPAMVEKGTERQTVSKEQGNVPTATAALGGGRQEYGQPPSGAYSGPKQGF